MCSKLSTAAQTNLWYAALCAHLQRITGMAAAATPTPLEGVTRVCVSLLLVRAEQSSGHQSFAHHVGLTRLWKAAERVWDSHPLNLPKPNESGKWGGMRYALTSQLPAPPWHRRQIRDDNLL